MRAHGQGVQRAQYTTGAARAQGCYADLPPRSWLLFIVRSGYRRCVRFPGWVRIFGWALAVAVLCGRPAAARAVHTATVAATPPTGDVAFVISGGVSLGVYQAGFLYLTTEISKRQGKFRIPLVTGASAGSANALITAMNSCMPPNDFPSADLGWQTWMPVGYQQLFVEREVTQLAAFTRAPLAEAMDKIYQQWKRGLPEDCDVVLGVTTTRVRAYSLEVHPSLKVPRQEEKFRFRIRGRGYGKPPRLENYIDPKGHFEQVIVPFEPDAEEAASRRNFNRMRDVLFASGAFPAAFEPQVVVNCMNRPYSDAVECRGRPRADLFVDGGVFDNNPLRLASQLADEGLRERPDGRAVWRDLRDEEDSRPRKSLGYVYLDPTTTAYPSFATDQPMARDPTILSFAQNVVGEWVTSARAKELFEAAQERADLGARMRLTESHFPMASNHIYAFLGFFERAFRFFDYHLGMYDAYVAAGRPNDVLPFSVDDAVQRIPESWRPFACMVGAFERDRAPLRAACALPGLESFQTLVQISLDRMYDHCRRFELAERYRAHVRCADAADGAPPIRIVPKPDIDLRRSSDEDQFDYFMRLLAAYRFHFKDLGLSREDAEYGKVKVRRKLLKMLNHLANAQGESDERLLLLTGGRTLVNTITYEPPRDWLYAEIGSVVEVGTSFLPFDWLESWARAHAAIQLKGLSTLLTPDKNKFGLVVAIGPEFEPLFITTSYLQPMIGARAAYQLTTRDTFGFRECTNDRAMGDLRLCSQFILQGYLAVAILERVRLQLTGEIYPIQRDFDDRNFDVQIAFGVHFF